MPSKSFLSTRELMRLVLLAALNLALFQGVWMIIVLPPITMIAAILNLTLYWTWVRRRRISIAFIGSTLTGLAIALVIMTYMAATGPNPTFATRVLSWFPDLAQRLMPTSLLGFDRNVVLDFALLDLLGFGSMFAAWWVVSFLVRLRTKQSRRPVGRSS